MSQSVTLRDIAIALNLSVATVSRALRESYDIEIGQLADEKLFAALKRKSAEDYETISLHTELRIRASSAPK